MKIIISLAEEYFVGLRCTILLQYMVQKIKFSNFSIIKTICENGAVYGVVHDVKKS